MTVVISTLPEETWGQTRQPSPEKVETPRAAPGTRMAYFTGHFPQASHTFFWREIHALRDLGCHVSIVSTRSPAPCLPPVGSGAATDAFMGWQLDAENETQYLAPFTLSMLFEALVGFLQAGPIGWFRMIAAIFLAGGSLVDRCKMLAFTPLAARLAYWSRSSHWQHIHVGFAEHAATIALLARRLGGPSYSISLGHSIRCSGPHQKLKWSDAVFGAAISLYLAEESKEYFEGRPPCPLVHAPRGIDVMRYERPGPYVPWAPSQGAARLVSCARITPNKGQDILIRAVHALKMEHGLIAQLRLAGDDTTGGQAFGRMLKELIETLEISDQVVFLGRLTPDEVTAELHAAHLSVIGASAEYVEGWGNAIAEAVCSGTPTIACRTGGVPETIDHGFNGLLAEPGDVVSMTKCLHQILTEPALAVRLGQNGPASIRHRFHRLRGAGVLINAMARSGSIQTQS